MPAEINTVSAPPTGVGTSVGVWVGVDVGVEVDVWVGVNVGVEVDVWVGIAFAVTVLASVALGNEVVGGSVQPYSKIAKKIAIDVIRMSFIALL